MDEVYDREIPFLQYHDENALSCIITLCYLSAGFPSVSAGFPSVSAHDDYDIIREEKSRKGYVDYLFKPKHKSDPAIILELKYGHSAQEASEQIKQKNYIEQVKDSKEIILVGINYDKQSKKHECIIEHAKRT